MAPESLASMAVRTAEVFLLTLSPLFSGYAIKRRFPSLSAWGRLPVEVFSVSLLFAFYLAARFLDVPLSTLAVFSGTLGLLSLTTFLKKIPKFSLSHWTASLGVLVILTWVGVYYEIPTDPLSHIEGVTRNPLSKLSYFWIALCLQPFSPSTALRLDLWQGVAGALLTFQFFRLFQVLDLSQTQKWIAFLATLAFWGTQILSYFRYYPFASGILPFIIYLSVLIEFLRDNRRSAFHLSVVMGVALTVAVCSHLQEAFFILVSTFIIFVIPRLTNARYQSFKKWLSWFFLFVLILHFLGFLLAQTGIVIPDSVLRILRYLITLDTHPFSPLYATLGIPGYAGLFAALFIWNEEKKSSPLAVLCLICLSISTLSLFGPSGKILSRIFGTDYVLYRLFYGSLYWIPLAVGSLLPFHKKASFVAGLLVLAMGLIPSPPFWGRLPHLVYRVPAVHDPKAYLPSLRYLSQAEPLFEYQLCRVFSDTHGNMALMAHSPWKFTGSRFHTPPTHWAKEDHLFLVSEWNDNNVCYLMFRKDLPYTPTWVATHSHQWDPTPNSPAYQVLPQYRKAFELDKKNFRKCYEDSLTEVWAFVPSLDRALGRLAKPPQLENGCPGNSTSRF